MAEKEDNISYIRKNKINDMVQSFKSFDEIKRSKIDVSSPKFSDATYNLGFAKEDLRL